MFQGGTRVVVSVALVDDDEHNREEEEHMLPIIVAGWPRVLRVNAIAVR
jgi:hypothetical protein